MRAVEFAEDVRAETLDAGIARGFTAEVVESCLAAIGRDIGREFDSLRLRPPGHQDRKLYQKQVEGLGMVEAVCEDQGDRVLIIRLRVGAFVRRR